MDRRKTMLTPNDIKKIEIKRCDFDKLEKPSGAFS